MPLTKLIEANMPPQRVRQVVLDLANRNGAIRNLPGAVVAALSEEFKIRVGKHQTFQAEVSANAALIARRVRLATER